MKSIHYTAGYKYQLTTDYIVETGITSKENIQTEYIDLTKEGRVVIRSGYASDGPSGWTIDTKNFMRGAFIHDSLYQLMRRGYLSESIYRIQADKLLREHCREDGMSWLRASYVYLALRVGGKEAAMPDNIKPIQIAP